MLASLIRLGAAFAMPIALAGTAAAQYETDAQPAGLMLFTGEDFRGEVREVFEPVSTLNAYYFNDRAQSVAVLSGAWELCEHSDFTGRCVFIRGDVQDLGWYGLDRELTSVRPIYEYTEAEHGLMFNRDRSGYIRYADNARYGYDDYSYGYGSSTRVSVYHYGYSPHYRSYGYYNPGLGHGPYGFGWTRYGANPNYGRHRHYTTRHKPLKGHYGARNGAVTLYTDSYERGASLGLNRGISDLSRYRFNDNVSSLRINSGKWEVCEHANFRGRCQIVDASTSRLNGLRLNDNISSIRPVGDVPRGDRNGRGDRPRDGRHDGRNGRGDGGHADRGGRGDGARGDRGGRRGGNLQTGNPSGADTLAGGRDAERIRRPHTTAPVRAPQRVDLGSSERTRPAVRSEPSGRRNTQRPNVNQTRQSTTQRNRNTTERRPTATPRTPQKAQMESRPKALNNARPQRQERPRPQQRRQVRQPATQQARPQQRQIRPQTRRQPQRAAPQQRSQPRPKPQPRPQQQQRSNNMPKALRNRGGGEVHKD